MSIFDRLKNNRGNSNNQHKVTIIKNKAYGLYAQEKDGYKDFYQCIKYIGKTNFIELQMEFTGCDHVLDLKPPAYVKSLEEPYSEQEIEQLKKQVSNIFYYDFLHKYYNMIYNIGDEGVVWVNGVFKGNRDEKILPTKIEFINNYRDILATFSNFPVLVLCDKDVASMYIKDDEYYSKGNMLECTDGTTYNFKEFREPSEL